MKKFIVLIIAALFLCSCNRVPAMDTGEEIETRGCEVGINLLENGDFSDGDYHWGSYEEGGSSTLIFRNGYLQVDIRSLGKVKHGVQVHYDGYRLINGGEYTLSFEASATVPKKIEVRPQLNGGDYHAYVLEEFELTEEVKKYTMDFTMTEDTDVVPRLAFNMGYFEGNEVECPVTITLANVSLVLHNEVIQEQAEARNILVNQIGYLPESQKTVFFHHEDTMDNKFRVINDAGEVVYEGRIGNRIENTIAGEYTFSGDFSKLTDVGTYYIETDSLGVSETFEIGNDIFADAFVDSMRMLYLQRCGCEISEELGGDFAHDICHNTTARIHGTYDYADVTGGWHDAGDYGRYTVPAAKTIADLLMAYRAVPEAFTDDTNILESGNGIPDVLDEVRYELEFMLQMQRDDGAVYHKITCAEFPPFIMPEDETELLLISPVSTAATADVAAVMAMAYEDYLSVDEEFANTCLDAAQNAWTFLEANGNIRFKQPMNIMTGAYGDTKDEDERYFAAAALYSATGEQKYHDVFKSMIKAEFAEDLGWQYMGGYGNAIYISMDNDLQDADTLSQIKALLIAEADEICELSKADGYNISLEEYEWGSNMVVLNKAMLLIMANDIQPDEKYINTAHEHLNYIFGANCLSVCYLTGHGDTPTLNPHHRPSMVVGYAMPGMVIGGPDEKLEDPTARIALEGKAPAKCYIDNAQSYSTNEVTTYWNSPLVYVMARLGMY